MQVPHMPRAARRTLAVAVATGVAAAGYATPALADTSSITVASATAVPEQAVPVDLTFSGTNALTGNAEVEAIVRPAGGLSCLTSYQEDTSTFPGQDTIIFAPGAQSVAPGAFQVAGSFKPTAPGSYQVCAWLEQNLNSTDQAVAPPATVTVGARGPQVSQLTVTVPKNPTPGVSFQVGYTTQTDQQLQLFSVLRAAAEGVCPSSFELDQAQNQPETSLTPVGMSVFGGPSTADVTTKQKTGSDVICTWVEGPNPAEVDDAASTPVTVGAPVPSAPPKPSLKLTKVTASHKHGASVTGTTAAGFTGRLQLTAACGASTARRNATARNRRFTATIGLPAGCRKAKKLKLTVSWAGSSAFAKQSVSRSVAIGS
jgi:hypothetical protein